MIDYLMWIKQIYNNVLLYTDYFSVQDIYVINQQTKNILNQAILENVDNVYEILKIKDKIEKEILSHNDIYIKNKIDSLTKQDKMVENKHLTYGQLKAILEDEKNKLILSSAGTGKTTMLLGQVKYLIEQKDANVEDILLLSFTNNAVNNLKNRLKKEFNKDFDVYTFHKYGLEVIKKVENKVPILLKEEQEKIIENILKELCENKAYFGSMIKCLFNINYDDLLQDIYTREDYLRYLKYNPPITMLGEKVKSYGELMIANYLIENGIKYIYEDKYQYDTNDEKYGQYYPDFYLPDYNVYIEYFGINKYKQVPSYFINNHSTNATEEYLNSIKWKEKVHKENNTILIETYFYEKEDGMLLFNLEKKLQEQGIQSQSVDSVDILNHLFKQKHNPLTGLCKIICNSINLIKEYQYTKENIVYLNSFKSNQIMNHNAMLLEIVWPIYEKYQDYLLQTNSYDFQDLIIQATNYIQDNRFKHSYKYILVDEFQDISNTKVSLLNVMRNKSNYDLICVGDDWQSIYNFNGSNIDVILNPEKYFGLFKVEEASSISYRYDNTVAIVSKLFIEKNKYQIKKEIKTIKEVKNGSISIIENLYETELKRDFLKSLRQCKENANVFLLSRYDIDKEFLLGIEDIELKYNNSNDKYFVKIKGREDLKIEFMTLHKAKGLECDYCYILNNRNDKMGFPSRIDEDEFILLLQQKKEFFEYAEERRLMYVGLTRAKEKTFLLNYMDNQSIFIEELKLNYYVNKI